MPIYVYKNLKTGETFDFEQRITESALTLHPETGDPVKRLIQPVGIAFKGSGFYVTDSRASKSSSKAAETKATETSVAETKVPDAKAETKVETKTETKTETKPVPS